MVSTENPGIKFDPEKAAKRLLISKYSCSDDDIRRDSMAFLYDKFKEHLEQQSDNSEDNAEDYQLSLSPLDLVTNENAVKENSKNSENQREMRQSTEQKHAPFDLAHNISNDIRFSDPDNSKNIDPRYSNFRQGSKGILTIDELCDDNKSTPSRDENRIRKIDNAQDDNSKLTLNTVSNGKSDMRGNVSQLSFIFIEQMRKTQYK
jgi:hypothetical protein